jgi:hypothetical protein
MLVMSSGLPPDWIANRAVISRERNQVYANELLKLPLREGKRWTLACDAAVLGVEHQGAISLLMSNGYYSVAHAVIRPLTETTIRAMWLVYAASYESVDRLSSGRAKPDLDDMAKGMIRCKTYPDLKPIAEAVTKVGSPFHDFAHAGIEQLRRRRNGFPLTEIRAGFVLTDLYGSMSAAVLASLYDSDSLRSAVEKNAWQIVEEAHREFGVALPGDDWSPRLPEPPDWKEPD